MSDHYWIDGNGTRRRNCCDSTYDRTHFDVCPRHRERAGMNRLSETERDCICAELAEAVGYRLNDDQLIAVCKIHTDALAARMASVKALHGQLVDRAMELDAAGDFTAEVYAAIATHLAAVLGSDAHAEEKDTGDA